MSILQKSNKKASSRHQINIQGVRDGILILPSRQYRTILEVSSVNFELKSEDERDAILDTYQSFLNSLAGPVQILVRIREMDMQRYLDGFRARLKDEKEDLYKQQVEHYIQFVQNLTKANKILARRFYVVVSHNDKDNAGFEAVREQLALSSDIIAKGLARLGVRSRHLDSLEVLDLFYGFYNPATAKRQPLTNKTMRLLRESYL